MEYKLSYDISSLVLLTILAFFYFNTSKYKNIQNSIFGVVVLDGILACFFDLLSAGILLTHFPEMIWANSLAIMLYQVTQHLMPILYYIYMIGVVYPSDYKFKLHSTHGYLLIPGIIILLTDIISPVTGLAYVYNETGYHRTVLYEIDVAVSAFYVLVCLVITFRHKNRTGFMPRLAVVTYSVLTVVLSIIQFNYPYLLVLNSAATISIFIMYLSLQSPALIKEALEEAESSRKAAEEANEAKSVFLANISHEIRTPMNAIFGMTYLLEDRDLKSDAREYVSTIRTASENLLSLINDILDFSKADSGKLNLDVTEYRIDELVRDVMSLMISQINQDKVAPTIFVSPEVPKVMKGDVIKVRQIIINFLSNAIKFTDDGQILLHISSTPRDGGKVMLAIKVKDTGIGIKESDRGKLFRQFEQIDMAKNRKREGAGLGLALVKRICELMNGHVELESEYGSGSTFTAVIEQDYVSDFPDDYKREASEYYFVIAEQNPYVRKSIERTLKSLDCSYTVGERMTPEVFSPAKSKRCSVICAFEDFDWLKKEAEEAGVNNASWLAVVDYGMGVPENLVDVFFERGPFSLFTLMDFLVQAKEKGASKPEENLYFNNAVKVAIVDDNKVNLKVTKAILAKFGIESETMLSGFEIIDAIKAGNSYDLIFMDHMMPEMDGVETVKKIRVLNVGNSGAVPIVALTANAVKGVEAEFLEVGMNDALFKPVVIDDLKRILIKWLPKN